VPPTFLPPVCIFEQNDILTKDVAICFSLLGRNFILRRSYIVILKLILKFFSFFLFQGKHIGRLGHQDPGEFPEEVKALFEKAVQYYEQNMILMLEIGDRAAQGRACGNLGNVHYLLVSKW